MEKKIILLFIIVRLLRQVEELYPYQRSYHEAVLQLPDQVGCPQESLHFKPNRPAYAVFPHLSTPFVQGPYQVADCLPASH